MYAGGIVGGNPSDGGQVRNCVTLNKSINTPGDSYGRIIGDGETATDLSNNYAWEYMQMGSNTINSKDGTNATQENLQSSTWWAGTTGPGWDINLIVNLLDGDIAIQAYPVN